VNSVSYSSFDTSAFSDAGIPVFFSNTGTTPLFKNCMGNKDAIVFLAFCVYALQMPRFHIALGIVRTDLIISTRLPGPVKDLEH